MINSNPLNFFKELKKPVTNYLVEQADKFPVNNKVLGNYLRAFHLSAPVNMMLLALYIPKNLFIILYSPNILNGIKIFLSILTESNLAPIKKLEISVGVNKVE